MAYVEVTLVAGVDGRTWVGGLTPEALNDPVLSRWFFAAEPCAEVVTG